MLMQNLESVLLLQSYETHFQQFLDQCSILFKESIIFLWLTIKRFLKKKFGQKTSDKSNNNPTDPGGTKTMKNSFNFFSQNNNFLILS